MAVTVELVGPERVGLVAWLFERYRAFYGRDPDPARSREFMVSRLSQKESVVLAALEVSGGGLEALGFAQLYPSFSSLALGRTWVINDLYVDELHRRKGIGRLLVGAALRFARNNGAVSVSLETARSNETAKGLYESFGFRLDDEFDHYVMDLT